MASIFSFSSSSASSDSENEMRDNIKFDINKIDFNKSHFSFKNASTSNLAGPTSKNSSRYFKKLKRKNETETRLINKHTTLPYTLLRPLKTNNSLSYLKNETNYNNKTPNFIKEQTEHLDHMNFSKDLSAYSMEFSSDSTDSLDMKYLKQISKPEEINSSSSESTETQKSKFYTKREKSNINSSIINKENIKPIELSMSLDSIDFSDVNINFTNSQNTDTDLYTNALKLDDIFLDCSLSNVCLIKKDNQDTNSDKLYPTPDTDNSFIQTKTLKPVSLQKPLPKNISFGINGDVPLSPTSADIAINLSDLTNPMNDDSIEYLQNQNTSISKSLLEIKPLQISFNYDDDKPLLQKQSDVIYQSDLNDFMSDESSKDILNQNIGILKPLLPTKSMQLNTSFETDNKLLPHDSTDDVINLPDLMSYVSTNEIQNKNDILTEDQEHVILNNEHSKIKKSKSFSFKDNSIKSEPTSNYYSKSNTLSNDSRLKCHQYNDRLKNKIKNTQVYSELKCKESKEQHKSKLSHDLHYHEDHLNESKPSISNYSKSNAESIRHIIDSTSKCHQYDNKLKNTSKKKLVQIDSKFKQKRHTNSNYSKLNTDIIDSKSMCYQSEFKIKNTQINDNPEDSRNKGQNKSKRSHIKTNISDVLPIKRPPSMKNIKKNISTINTEITEDIGLEYDTSKDDYMVELPNGGVIPAFLSTLKPKYGKKLCACGIPTSEVPNYWSESFHESLHQNIYKLRFKGNVSDDDMINVKQNNLFYKILILGTKYYNDGIIKKSVKEVNDFVCLEYGILKTGILSFKNEIYLAVLPNFKVIGYLEVEPIHKAYKLNEEQEQSIENKVSVKFGVPKIWVLVKYKNKNVDINLLETFRKKENLQKEDLAFSLGGCLGVQFIQKYTENKTILIYKQ